MLKDLYRQRSSGISQHTQHHHQHNTFTFSLSCYIPVVIFASKEKYSGFPLESEEFPENVEQETRRQQKGCDLLMDLMTLFAIQDLNRQWTSVLCDFKIKELSVWDRWSWQRWSNTDPSLFLLKQIWQSSLLSVTLSWKRQSSCHLLFLL